MMEQTYVAAGYCRLSRDDGGIESVSIETQKTMISDYCKTNNILLYRVRCNSVSNQQRICLYLIFQEY